MNSERPKRPKSVSAETEISAKLTETSAEISAEILSKIMWNGAKFSIFLFHTLEMVTNTLNSNEKAIQFLF